VFGRRFKRYLEKRDEESRRRDEAREAESRQREEAREAEARQREETRRVEARKRDQELNAESRRREEESKAESRKRDEEFKAEARKRDEEGRARWAEIKELRAKSDARAEETREFNREILLRNEKVYTSLIAEMEESTKQLRANTQAVLSVLDRLNGSS
jgi:hypothetical protein